MASIKKVKPIKIIEVKEFIDCLILKTLWDEERLMFDKMDTRSEQLAQIQWMNKCRTNLLNFELKYGHSFYDTSNDIFRWGNFFEGNSILETYDNYVAFISELISQDQKEPLKTNHINVWFFNGFIYEVKGYYTDNEIRLLILEDFDKERKYFEKLKTKFDETKESEFAFERPRIPENVRIEVWRRDGGKCAKCGSRERLEYDHIVPISKGGSNTARNIELLCEKCNRSKSNNVV
jgi:HNH endonuclease